MGISRAKAIRAVAGSRNMDELQKLAQHQNRHVEHAALVKGYRIDPSAAWVEKALKEIQDAVNKYDAEMAEYYTKLAEWAQGLPEPAKPVPLDATAWRTYRYIRKLQNSEPQTT